MTTRAKDVQWQPISTAPKYREILTLNLRNGNREVLSLAEDDRVDGDVYVWQSWDGEPIDEPLHQPTHWFDMDTLELPAPPSEHGERE